MASRVHELAQALTDTERKELVDRIQRSLSLTKKEGSAIYHTPVSQDYRQQMIRQGLHELGMWQRLKLWIKRIVTGKTDEDIYVDSKMSDIARHVETRQLADLEARYAMPMLAQHLFRLYVRVSPLLNFFKNLWGSEKNMREAVQYVLKQKIPRAKMNIHDFISSEELENIFETSESKASLRQELLNRLNVYMDSIPADVFTSIEEGLLPLYYLKEVCFFDFEAFFRFFQVELRGMDPAGQPNFKSAAVDKILDELEHLYYALHTARKGGTGDQMHAELFEHFRLTKNQAKDSVSEAANSHAGDDLFMPPPASDNPVETTKTESQQAAEKTETENKESFAKNVRRDIRELKKEIDATMESTQLADIIRLFRMDPYYKFLAYVPSLNLRDFFYASIRMELMESLDAEFTALRKRVIERIISQVFHGSLREFEYYKTHPIMMNRSGLPGFRYVRSLCIIYNYLGTIFIGYVRDMLRLLMKVLPARNRDSTGELNFHINGVESLHDKIKLLDLSYASENEEGKNLNRMRVNMDKDISQERTYRIYTAQKDKEIRILLEEGIDHLRILSETLDEILKLPADMIDERFQSASGMQLQGSFHTRFSDISREIKMIQRAARYQRVLEEEQY